MKTYVLATLGLILGTSVSSGSTCVPVEKAAGALNSSLSTVFSLAKDTKVDAIFKADTKWTKPITLFLPVNTAFGKLPSAVVDAVRKDAGLRENVLLDHAISGRVSFVKFLSLYEEELPRITSGNSADYFYKAGFPQSLLALQQAPQNFFFGGRSLRAGGTNFITKAELNWGSEASAFRGAFRDGTATFVGVDYDTCVGVVHVIDTVITRNDEH